MKPVKDKDGQEWYLAKVGKSHDVLIARIPDELLQALHTQPGDQIALRVVGPNIEGKVAKISI